MKRLAIALLACFSLTASAQAPQPSKEQLLQMQQMLMAQQIQAMASLYDLRYSRLGFDETVGAIKSGAEKRGWKLGGIHDVQAEMRTTGVKDARRMKAINLCPVGANERVAKASGGKAPALPCRVTVFETADGKINVVRMNLHSLAKGMQGDLSKVLGELAVEEDALYKGILE
ncbi:MAG: DUF302 domain-containing protein [Pseudomonadota bacterium]|nr:DUF302 domain-containing protein [Pseudomonadota bacterium]MDP1906271.1 DUF302 domain-containing protein [Pseudomonadota bacterium]MDP2351638.1 DUF302 domain-containing protein [Pseudomonadota bacterium]